MIKRSLLGGRLPARRLRLLTTSSSPFASSSSPRPPTFTTPDVPLARAQVHDPKAPLPPTDLPIEDYASPLLHTGSFFAKLFRYSVFGSVSIVLLGGGSWLAAHAWVERVELKGAKGSQDDDLGCWDEEREGWSGAHLGGGTDPRLGTITRFIVRAAWMTQNWAGASNTLSPVGGSPKSPFSVGGPMIGTASSSATTSAAMRQSGDAGYHQSEAFLVQALQIAAKKGISLGFPADEAAGRRNVDRAAVELEQRLASVRERIGGLQHVELAREGWERIFYALASTAEPTPWEQREKLRATRKLGELSSRIAGMWREGSQEAQVEKVKAEGWFLGGLLPALRADRASVPVLDVREAKKAASPSSSFFGFWSRSHPPSTSSPTVPPSVRPELAAMIHALSSPSPSPSHPALERLILSSLISLETFLARTRQLPSALALQTSSLSYANALHLSPSFLASPSPLNVTTPSASSALPWTLSSSWVSHALLELTLASKLALLSTHRAETLLALHADEGKEPEALLSLQGAINDSEKILGALEGSPYTGMLDEGTKKMQKKVARGNKEWGKRYEGAIKSLERDAALTAGIASRLTALVHEVGCGSLAPVNRAWGRSTKEWCGGDAMAEAFWSKALTFVEGNKEAMEGVRRTKGMVLGAKMA